MEHAYATALWKLVEGGMEHRKAVAAIRERLTAEGRERLLPRVARAFERLALRDAKKNDLVLSVAHAKEEVKAKREAHEALRAMGVSADLKTQVDDSLVGGWRLEGRDILIDHSYKKQLLDIYNRSIA